MNGKPRDKAGITDQDVLDLQMELDMQLNMVIRLEMNIAETAGGSLYWWVKAVAEPRTLTRNVHRKGGVAVARYPGREARTLHGAMYRALWDLQRVMEDLERDELSRDAPQQRKMF